MFLIQVSSLKGQWHKWMSNMTSVTACHNQGLITKTIVCELQPGETMIKIVDARLPAVTEFTGGINGWFTTLMKKKIILGSFNYEI